MVIRGKKGWIRIVEAAIAILIFAGVMLMVYSQKAEEIDVSDRIYEIETKILADIVYDDDLRAKVLEGEVYDLDGDGVMEINADLEAFIEESIRLRTGDTLAFEVRICDVDNLVCNMGDFPGTDVYVEERIISVNLDSSTFNPKKIRLFVWFAG